MSTRRAPSRVVTFTLVNPVWQYILWVRAGGTREQASAWAVGKIDRIDSTSGSWSIDEALTFKRDGVASNAIWFRASRPTPGMIAHEALHSAAHVLRTAGLGPMTRETEEAYTYLTQWGVREITARLESARRRRLKPRKR